jgi:hypothetical protein
VAAPAQMFATVQTVIPHPVMFRASEMRSSRRLDAQRTARRASVDRRESRRVQMLETIAVILIVLWLLGLVTSYTMGGFIHALLVIAIIVIVIRVIQGRRV